MSVFSLDTPIVYLKGVGPQKAKLLQGELGIFTFGDLLYNFPFRYIDRTTFYKIKDVNPSSYSVQIIARLIGLQRIGEGRKKRLIALLKDDTGVLELVWFQGVSFLEKKLEVGKAYVVFGKPSVFSNKLTISHPELELYPPPRTSLGNLKYQPVYSSTERLKRSQLDSKGIQRLVFNLLESIGNQIEESIPHYIMEKFSIIPLQRALVDIHFPPNEIALKAAIKRLKVEELFFLQLKILKNKAAHASRFKGALFAKVGYYFTTCFKERLKFELTDAQKRVLREIRKDTLSGAQMNRLLQGDVGSGKTIVAFLSMLFALDNGFQACLMAPTEILAQQHFQAFLALLGEDFCTIALLTGSTKTVERRRIHAGLEDGSLQILIGTHALLEDKVQFKNLGLVVIDEQHRFGVEQRAKLWKKNRIPPHMLVMTATPIPRTLAMTVYGDLDLSVIDELPSGRKPIKTVHLFESSRLRMFGYLRQEIAKGRQVYVVYPLIEENEQLDLLHLEAGIESLSREFPKPQFQLSIVHGRLTAKEKESEMQRFIKGETQIMVATTVIEVGVNVPNASVMVIENAERFGLSQLHQLRGRVGRGGEQSYCILMSSNKLSREGRLRLSTMVETTDGFKIAEIDLQLRGPGDLGGTQQSGVLDLKMADLSTDQFLLKQVREVLVSVFDEDPSLSLEKNKLLNTYLSRKDSGISWDKIS